MSFTGDPFAPWVKTQIDQRQQAFGATQRTPEQVQYLFNKGAWVRVASSVNVTPETAQELGADNLAGNSLAKGFVLFGGITNTIGGYTPPRGGIVPDQTTRDSLINAAQYSYGFGTSEYGYTAPPGIDSVKIQHQNRGAIRKYNIRLKAQNIDQFKIIDALYLRLGYYLLVEWGHTHYLNNSGQLVQAEFLTPAYNTFFGTGTGNEILGNINSSRQESFGNYDGGLVMVNNFTWNFNADGSYDITIDAISSGGLIDSFTLNQTGPNITTFNKENENSTPLTKEDFPSDILIANQGKTSLNDYLLLAALEVKNNANWVKINDIERYKDGGDGFVAIKFEQENKPEQYYIRLGEVLFHIQDVALKLMVNNSAGDNAVNNSEPLVNIQTEPIMFTHFFQQSVDPLVCLMPFDLDSLTSQELNSKFGQSDTKLNDILTNNFRNNDNPYKGNAGNIRVNIDFVAKKLEEATDSDGNINCVSFLTKLMEGINKATGNMNNFSVSYDEVTNTLRIIDDTVIPGNTTPPTALRVFGVKENEGSFVRNVSMTSKITNKLATTIAIGATATDTSINDSVPLLGKWNLGLTDRVKQASQGLLSQNQTNDNSKASEALAKNFETIIDYIGNTYVNWKLPSSQDITKAKSALAAIVKHDLAVKTQKGNFPSKGFIPIDLSVEIDGISGVLQYQKFSLTPNVLPPSYENKIDFLIQGIDHTIQNNEWVTSYTTLSVVKPANTALNSSDNKSFSSLQ